MIFNGETFRNYFLSSFAYSLVMWLMRSPKNFEKIANVKIWQLISIWGSKTNFGKIPLKWCIFKHKKNVFYQYRSLVVFALTKCSLYGLYMIFWSFFGTITYSKENLCFKLSIFQWQIKLNSYLSEFWHLRRKSAVISSRWLFSQNSLMISLTT